MKLGRKVTVTITLKDEDKLTIKNMLKKGHNSVRVMKRALVLNLFNNGMSSVDISKVAEVTPETARRIAKNYNEEGLSRALFDNPRPGKEKLLSEKEEKEIIAIVCSDPPAGCYRWTLELLKEEVLKRKIVKSIGRETIRLVLKDNKFKPWLKKNVVCSKNR